MRESENPESTENVVWLTRGELVPSALSPSPTIYKDAPAAPKAFVLPFILSLSASPCLCLSHIGISTFSSNYCLKEEQSLLWLLYFHV